MTRLEDGSRFSFGGDEFIFVELSEEMSLKTTLRVIAITDKLRSQQIPGLVDICPAHVSYMLRVAPEEIDPRDTIGPLEAAHRACGDTSPPIIETRLIELPVLYDDPWTRETLLRFRDRHQAPDLTDLQYCAQVNGFSNVEDLVAAHSANPFIATFIGFMPGNAECYQLVPRALQLEAPKYLRPRTDTPERAVGHGGAFTTVYPVRGAGGFQLLGRSAVPVFDLAHRLVDFEDHMVLPRAGDIFTYRPIDAQEYTHIRSLVEDGTYRYRIRAATFDLAAFNEGPSDYNRRLLGSLSDD